jgi:hypothetical protein
MATACHAVEPEPLPFPVYVAGRISGDIIIDGTLSEAAWRETSLGWGLSHSLEPNVLCPDPTLFRIGYDDESVFISLACYQREVQDDLPEHIWKPRETDVMDLQATPRYARMRGVIPPVNTADVLISRDGRTVTIHFAPPNEPSVKVHDSLGERDLEVAMEHGYNGDPDDRLWTVEFRASWAELGFVKPSDGADWALNVYRDIRFFSNWSFIAWMRKWAKAEYSRHDMTDRFGRVFFFEQPDRSEIEDMGKKIASKRGPVRIFMPESLILIDTEGRVVRQRYADRLRSLRRYGEDIFRDRRRIGNDLPYHPFFTEKGPRSHLAEASRKLNRLRDALNAPPPWDDPAASVALISHAIPEARQGLFTYKKERLYRGLPE